VGKMQWQEKALAEKQGQKRVHQSHGTGEYKIGILRGAKEPADCSERSKMRFYGNLLVRLRDSYTNLVCGAPTIQQNRSTEPSPEPAQPSPEPELESELSPPNRIRLVSCTRNEARNGIPAPNPVSSARATLRYRWYVAVLQSMLRSATRTSRVYPRSTASRTAASQRRCTAPPTRRRGKTRPQRSQQRSGKLPAQIRSSRVCSLQVVRAVAGARRHA
jgi:hypothetical protein